jgi:ADP-ribosylglycohydrolase
MKNHLNLFKNILLAGACGDALGYKVEFDKWYSIKSRYGIAGIRLEGFKNSKLIVSDDTQMTLFALEALIPFLQNTKLNEDFLLNAVFNQYLEWLKTQQDEKSHNELNQFESLNVRRAPGNTCLSSLLSKKAGTLNIPRNTSKGCGGIMRVAPFSFLKISIDKVFDLGAKQAVLTHGHPIAYLSSGFFAGFLKALICGYDFWTAYDINKHLIKNYDHYEDFLNYLNLFERYAKEFISPENI